MSLKNSIPKVGAAVRSMGSPMTLTGIGANLGLGVIARTMGGDPLGSAILKEIPSSILFGLAPGLGWASMALSVGAGLTNAGIQANKTLGVNYNNRHKSGPVFNYMDTNQAITMRQAAVQAIQGSKINGRNALGGEARMLHVAYGDRLL